MSHLIPVISGQVLDCYVTRRFGQNLFRDWKLTKWDENNVFVFDDPTFTGQVLVAGKNSDSGSSRERMGDLGFRVVVSSFFADIFRNNALNNGLLPVMVPEDYLNYMLELVKRDPKTTVRIDLGRQIILDLPRWKSHKL